MEKSKLLFCQKLVNLQNLKNVTHIIIDQLTKWESVKSILVVESKRKKNQIVQENTRFYICNFVPKPKKQIIM